MKTTVQLEIASFKVPDRIAVKGSIGMKNEGYTDQRTLHLSEVDPETLAKLCDEFRENVFKVAAKVMR